MINQVLEQIREQLTFNNFVAVYAIMKRHVEFVGVPRIWSVRAAVKAVGNDRGRNSFGRGYCTSGGRCARIRNRIRAEIAINRVNFYL